MNRRGFTLLELMIVIIIIGVLAGLAFPQMFKAAERARKAEGISLAGLIRASEIRYYDEHGAYATAVANLDVSYTTPKYFTVTSVGTSASNLATLTRNATDRPAAYGAYTIVIQEDGTVTAGGP